MRKKRERDWSLDGYGGLCGRPARANQRAAASRLNYGSMDVARENWGNKLLYRIDRDDSCYGVFIRTEKNIITGWLYKGCSDDLMGTAYTSGLFAPGNHNGVGTTEFSQTKIADRA